MKNRTRMNWIDVVKFFGIFAIYLGHFGKGAGLGYNFVFAWHVPLFFFVSGCMETYSDKNESFFKTVIKSAKNILVPFFFFCILYIVFSTLRNGTSIDAVWIDLLLLAKGSIRNNGLGGGLWFLSCLFVMKLIFAIVKKLKSNLLILIVCLSSFWCAARIIFPLSGAPAWPWNVDSALYYIIFYGIGYIAYSRIHKLFQFETKKDIIVFIFTGILSGIYTALLFFERDMLLVLNRFDILSIWMPIVRALVVIWFCFAAAYCCKNVTLFSEIGKNTLYLCGSEWIIKNSVPCLLSIVGLSGGASDFQFVYPLSAYMYTFILLVIANKYIVPVEKRCIAWLQEHFKMMVVRFRGCANQRSQ